MTGPNPKFTICLPTIGRIDYIRHTFASIKCQTVSDFEVIVLDNASDSTATRLIHDLIGDDIRFRVVSHPARVPMFENFGAGIREAKGDYTVFFHDDDTYKPEFLGTHLEIFESNPAVVFSGSNHEEINQAGEVICTRRFNQNDRRLLAVEFITQILSRGRSPVSTPGIVYRTEFLKRHPFDPSISVHWGDFVFLMRLAEHGEVYLSQKVLWQYRIHSEAISQKANVAKEICGRTQILSDFIDEFLSRHGEQYRPQFEMLRNRLFDQEVIALSWFALNSPSRRDSLKVLGIRSKIYRDNATRLAIRSVAALLTFLTGFNFRQRWLFPLGKKIGFQLGF
jgi:glycosyltransferase involved in cell wall biosynthesis